MPLAVYHVGRHRLWGPPLDVLLRLLDRLERPESGPEFPAGSLN